MNENKKKLSSLVKIQSGVTIRGKVTDDPDGDTAVIQMRNISKDFSRIDNEPYKVDGRKFRANNFLRGGDLLFISKGQNNFSVPYLEDFQAAVAVSFFFVIRVKDEMRGTVDPMYLNWFINSPIAQRELSKGKEGTQIKNINKKTLEELDVILPSLKEQVLIAKIHELQITETAILNRVNEKREALTTNFLINYLTKSIIADD